MSFRLFSFRLPGEGRDPEVFDPFVEQITRVRVCGFTEIQRSQHVPLSSLDPGIRREDGLKVQGQEDGLKVQGRDDGNINKTNKRLTSTYETASSSSGVPSFRGLLGVCFGLILFCTLGFSAAAPAKEEVLKKYEKAVSLADELNVYQQDVYRVLPKIRLASKALLQSDLEQADRVLEDALADLAVLESKRPQQMSRDFKLEWLEIYLEVFQKYALLALFAFFLVRWPFYRKKFKAESLTFPSKILLTLLVIVLGGFLSLFDLGRYGESAYAFFDIQVVLIVLGGLLGGPLVGIVSGLGLAIFRWFLQPAFLVYPGIVLGAGVLSGVLSFARRSYKTAGRLAFLTGLVAGIFHGAMIFVPLGRWMSPAYFYFSIGFIALLEAVGAYIFMAVIAAILKEEDRREMERELLRTKLLFLQAQMNPHFLFNALNTISVICGEENAARAKTLILRLSDFLRRTLKRENELVTLKEEMSYIDGYLEIERARFGDRLQIEKKITIREESWNTPLPLLILQPLVENAVKHGTGKKPEGGMVKIGITETGDHLRLEVSDDGPGVRLAEVQSILAGKAESREGAGIGIRNIHERLVRRYGGCGLQFISESGGGTKVVVEIPIFSKPVKKSS